MRYFISDTHFDHENIMRYCNRPFESVEQMNTTIINNINSVVSENDILYFLGDFSLRGDYERLKRFRDRINCKNLILIKGNHDKEACYSIFKEVHDYLELSDDGGFFVLMHYPISAWKNSRREHCYHLHGHIHSTPDYNLKNRDNGIHRLDVGVDANNFMPLSVKDIINFFKDSKFIPENNDFDCRKNR